MSNIFADNIAVNAGIEGLRRAFIAPVVTVPEPHNIKGRSIKVLVRETSPSGFPIDKEFVFRVYADGQVIIWEALDEDLSEVMESVKEFVADEAAQYGFQYPRDWVLEQEEEEAHLRDLYKNDAVGLSLPGRLG